MADVDFITYSMVDAKGSTASLPVFFATGLTDAQLLAASNLIAAELDAITGAEIVAATLTRSIALPAGIKSSPSALVDIEKGWNLGMDALNTDYRHTLRIPAIAPGVVNGDVVDLVDSDVDDFVQAIVNGVSPATPTDRYANDLNSVVGNHVTFRKA